jgi:molybdenum ABC transporter molybdate-binding protein
MRLASPLPLVIALCALAAGCRREPSISIRVAIAPEAAPAFEVLGTEFLRTGAVGVTWHPGDPDAQSRQMLESATGPYDVYVSLESGTVGSLVSAGRCDDLSRTFAGFATLVVITSPAAPRLDEVRAIADPRYRRIAVLGSERNPFNRATFQVLASLGLREQLAPRLVRVDTARQAIDLVRGGGAEAAFVPRMMITEGDSLAVPIELHRAIEQVGVVCARDPARRDAAARFLQYARAGDGRGLLEAYGFLFP